MSQPDIKKHAFYEQTIESKPIYDGRIIKVQVDTVRLPNGETSTRELVRHPGAVAVIALLDGKLLVVEQFRKALERAQVEIPAGKLEPGEDPREAALRELEEETGYRAKTIRHLQTFSTSPGFAEEVIHLYYADDLEAGEVNLDEEEFLTCEAITLEQADAYIREGRIYDAKTLLAVAYWRLGQLAGNE
ncbi:NUDIX domain-containing protein [Cohnella thailandensis]|uniref:NUDIX hydrolase n=1 Tax=Cohnella thailandensis TaxID=557557 RepID=A0A841SU84_9BACL|nr:NUDIX hydrolase [Cohnella thailandensis]MBB6635484.1 NUDIX hydrolase [Cohnella thailandensis]MBP1974864.1 ADP-ribose pyrophosphatase [Cohnella thailandensis]